VDMEVVFPGGKRVNAVYKGFTIETDQSKENGGEGSAPAPFDLFLASLGTCSGLYVLLFCQARHIPTEELKLILHLERNSESRMVEKIVLEIQLPREFPEKYREAVIKVAGKCVVKKHLENAPGFEIYTRTAGKSS